MEGGELAARLDGPAALFESARPEAGWHPVPPSSPGLELRGGDALLLPPGTRHTVTNTRGRPASALGVALLPTAALADAGRPEEAADPWLAGVYDPRRAGTRVALGGGVVIETLAAGIGVARTGPCVAAGRTSVAVTRFALAPGEAIPAHRVAGLELLAFDAGGLEVDGLDASGDPPPAGVQAGVVAGPAAAVRGSGRGLALPAPAAPGVRNAGPHPLRLVAVALTPTGDTACAVAPAES
ncbi:MAG: hypothetical protein AVDCRST_MAG59-4087 [uncultured Thermomicrobiales bacterium]|uniref:Uncharacterized protein n=1 Tax=uncultured Thermomicrobiales bacterium TaxID=1645740 RepID=A0A6J4VEE1_9BACT|nr:MAG: hypothetical protein AVDCRST_MAG59-4087 [uncultured Thermomicrobiales bacterium]